MTNPVPVTKNEMDKYAKRLGLASYNEKAMKRIVLISRLGFDQSIHDYKHAEAQIITSAAARDYGEDWESDADAVRNFIAAAESTDKPEVITYLPTDQAVRLAKANAISLDENGNLRPHSAFPRYRGAIVNQEDEKIHSWKLE